MDNALTSSDFMVLNSKDGILSHWIGSLTRHLALDKQERWGVMIVLGLIAYNKFNAW